MSIASELEDQRRRRAFYFAQTRRALRAAHGGSGRSVASLAAALSRQSNSLLSDLRQLEEEGQAHQVGELWFPGGAPTGLRVVEPEAAVEERPCPRASVLELLDASRGGRMFGSEIRAGVLARHPGMSERDVVTALEGLEASGEITNHSGLIQRPQPAPPATPEVDMKGKAKGKRRSKVQIVEAIHEAAKRVAPCKLGELAAEAEVTNNQVREAAAELGLVLERGSRCVMVRLSSPAVQPEAPVVPAPAGVPAPRPEVHTPVHEPSSLEQLVNGCLDRCGIPSAPEGAGIEYRLGIVEGRLGS
ncbi:MAG: hypothetical protein AAF211_03010 [Myxococcota bacterium]